MLVAGTERSAVRYPSIAGSGFRWVPALSGDVAVLPRLRLHKCGLLLQMVVVKFDHLHNSFDICVAHRITVNL